VVIKNWIKKKAIGEAGVNSIKYNPRLVEKMLSGPRDQPTQKQGYPSPFAPKGPGHIQAALHIFGLVCA